MRSGFEVRLEKAVKLPDTPLLPHLPPVLTGMALRILKEQLGRAGGEIVAHGIKSQVD